MLGFIVSFLLYVSIGTILSYSYYSQTKENSKSALIGIVAFWPIWIIIVLLMNGGGRSDGSVCV